MVTSELMLDVLSLCRLGRRAGLEGCSLRRREAEDGHGPHVLPQARHAHMFSHTHVLSRTHTHAGAHTFSHTDVIAPARPRIQVGVRLLGISCCPT